MKRFTSFLVMALFATMAMAQSVGYNYKPLADEGCKVEYSVVKQENRYLLVVEMRSDMLKFIKDPIMKVRTFDDQVFSLNGANLGESAQGGGLIVKGIILPSSKVNTTAQFEITEAQLELLKQGVKKVSLTTTPIEHEREFKKDKIGKGLYELYIEKKNKSKAF